MEHLAIMKKGYIEKILSGEKSIESRFSLHKIAPYQQIRPGEKVYLQETGKMVTASFDVEKVLFFNDLNEAKIDQLRREYGHAICAGDEFWDMKRSARYATLLFIKNPVTITPFQVHKTDRSAFKSVETIEMLTHSLRTITKHPHDCPNGKHYFVFDGTTTHCAFCGAPFLHKAELQRFPPYERVKAILATSQWNSEWLSAPLDPVAQTRLPISKSQVKKRLDASVKTLGNHDGRQTPYHGHPIYYAQHGLGCCCRKCIEKFYGIPKDRGLSDQEMDYFSDLILAHIGNIP